MRFIIRPGSDPVARADANLLAAMGLPGGGIVALGKTHCLVSPGDVPGPNALTVGPLVRENGDVALGTSIDVVRTVVPQARRVIVVGGERLDARHLARSLQGNVVSVGDRIAVHGSYGEHDEEERVVRVVSVEPGPAGTVGDRTVVHDSEDVAPDVTAQPSGRPPGETLSTADALLTGLDTELETLVGWITLLTSSSDLPGSWGLPSVAGVIVEGPAGCGRSELVAAAAQEAGVAVREISLDLVFKPERLLTLLERAVKDSVPPVVLFVDRLDAVAGSDGMFKNQVAAIMRWFLDAVAQRPGMACVLGVHSAAALGDELAKAPLLPRSLAVPPPDIKRRRRLFEAALARVPTTEIDFDRLASRTAGFSGADVVSAVLQASAGAAGSGKPVDHETLEAAIDGTTPSLGNTSSGEIPGYGFDRVANLTDVKQRLTESVIWQMQDPDRFTRLGIEPPRGLLLYGPPGTGKTYVIRALAHESGAAFFPIKGAELLDKWVGESERAVREVFARARAVAPAILFFDEIDALAPIRGNSTNSVTDSVVAALLTEMDGVSERGDVFVIGATNRRDLIDPALLRPGRLEVQLRLGLPAPEARSAFFDISDVPFAADVDLGALVERTQGYSFAELSGLLREAALIALRNDPTAITVDAEGLDTAITAKSALADHPE
ncbi:MAG: ATP-binding protein [Acidimicrobiia bacterium]|jgi:transitional endoplasmic reticulum ATPase